MKNNKLTREYRDVRTLLFGKITPERHNQEQDGYKAHDELYIQIHNAAMKRCSTQRSSTVQTFLAFGGYDAICVYPTNLDPKAPDWLHEIYKDKQQILRVPTNDVVYHQMHLVSQHPDTETFWVSSEEEYPFFLTSVVYGVNISERSQRDNRYGGSCYEQVLRKRLDAHVAKTTKDIKYAVYSGITAGDVVVLWRTRDLRDALDIITYIEYSGTARKTLTTLGFPIDGTSGQIKNCVMDTLINNLHKHITVSMHGSVRNIRRCMEIVTMFTQEQASNTAGASSELIRKIEQSVKTLTSEAYVDEIARNKLRALLLGGEWKGNFDKIFQRSLSNEDFLMQIKPFQAHILRNVRCIFPEYRWSQSLGKSDFSVFACISYANLANLLEAYRVHHVKLSDACWEFMTDINVDHPVASREWFEESMKPANVLCDLYTDFQKLFQDNGGELCLSDFAWFNAFQELLGTHHYIDHHPVLHGPSYLIYSCLRIVYAYFSGKVSNYETVEKRRQLLKRSEEQIVAFIRNLDQLTEQISRNDDAILNNRTNTHTIHFSLPENALEFYHAFLRRIVAYLTEYDRREGLVPDGFEYDFLLSPKTCSRFRFRPIFRAEHSDHGYYYDKIWPSKQAYILELPLESIFKPIDILIPFVHECFHCFGDVLRQRPLRRQYMTLFVSANLLTAVGMGGAAYQDMYMGLAKLIYESIDDNTSPYLSITWHQLARKTYQVIETNAADILSGPIGCAVSEDTLSLWRTAKESLLSIDTSISTFEDRVTVADAILRHCHSYFTECYADAMTIALLQLSPFEYLDRSLDELRRFHYAHSPWSDPLESDTRYDRQRTHLAQRFAIVLVACSKHRHPRLAHFTVDKCIEAIQNYSTASNCTDSLEEYDRFSQTLMQNFKSLINPRIPLPPGCSLHPPAALQNVIDYLADSIDLLYDNPPSMPINSELREQYNIDDLVRDFDEIIRNGNMFGKTFYDFIYSHHKEIRNAADV